MEFFAPYLKEFLLVATVHLLAVMSPGPDFAMVLRNSLTYSRRSGLFAAVGLGLGMLVHVVYSLVGIGLVISQSIILFNGIKYLGAAYLIFIGWKSLRAPPLTIDGKAQSTRKDLEPLASLRLGFFTNVLNPKATLFFLSLFTQVIRPSTPLGIQIFYGLEMALMTTVWFSAVAMLLTRRGIQRRFQKVQQHFERAFGVLLIALGIRVAFAQSK